MQFNSVKRGNFSGLARSVNRATDQVFESARSTSVDHTAIAKESIKGRSMERRAAMKAEGKVARAGLEAVSKTKQYKDTADMLIDVGKEKGKKERMAGVVGALGSLATGVATRKYLDRQDEREAERDKERLAWRERVLKAMSRPGEKPPKMEYPDLIDPDVKPPSVDTSSGGNSGNGSQSQTQQISAQPAFDPSKKMSRDQITSLAQSVGFSPEASNIVYGIAGGESGFDPTNSTRRLKGGLYDTTGEDSVGLMQINWGYHKDKGWLQSLGITKREDLFDPVKNMKAAKYLYDGRGGGFQDWTVYNKGIYKDYL